MVILSFRADFYGHCAAHPELARLVAANQVLVGSMTEEELRRAVELPARRVGVQIESALTERLVTEAAQEPGALSLLSTALVEQTTAVSPDRLGESVGRLDAGELRDLDAALALVLGL